MKFFLGERLAFYSTLCAILWLAGFLFSLPGIPPYELSRLAAVTGVLCAAVIALSVKLSSADSWPARPSSLFIIAGLFCGVIAMSVICSAIPFVAFTGACTFLVLPASVLIILSVVNLPVFWRLAGWGAGGVLFLLASWAIFQFIFLPSWLVHGQVRWPFANPASYAALLMLGVFPALAAAETTRKLTRLAGWGLALVSVMAILVIGSLGVVLSLLGGFVLFAFLTRRSLAQPRKIWLMMLAAMIAGLVISVGLHIFAPAGQRLVEIGAGSTWADKTNSLGVRLAIWRATVAMIAAHPWIGTGIGTFFLYYPQYRLTADTDSGGFMAHNDPLQFGAEAGLLAPFLFYAFLIAAGFRMVRFLRVAPVGNAARVLPVSMFCALAALIVHAHIDFDFYQAPILAGAGLLLGQWYRGTAIDSPATARLIRLSSDQAWAICLLPALLLIFALQGLLRSEYKLDHAAALLTAGDMNGFIAAVNQADRLAFHRNARAQLMAADVPLGVLRAPLVILMPDQARNLQGQVARLLNDAAANNPRLVAIAYDRALSAASHNDRAAAEQDLQAALTLDSLHLPSRILLARLYNHDGRDAQALSVLKAGLQWAPIARGQAAGSVEYFALLARLARSAGDKATAAQAQSMLTHLIHS